MTGFMSYMTSRRNNMQLKQCFKIVQVDVFELGVKNSMVVEG